MKFRMLGLVGASCLMLATLGVTAATIKLKDGRVLTGDLKKNGGSYTIVQDNGQRVIVAASAIVEVDGKPFGVEAKPDGGESAELPAGAVFKQTKAKADKVEDAILAVQIWDNFLEKYPTSTDLEAAKAEKEKWDKLYKDGAEKIKDKWVSGKEVKEIKKKCDELYEQAVDQTKEAGLRGVGGMKKLDEILAMYPKHFWANYEKGFYLVTVASRIEQGANDKLTQGVKALERTRDLAPTVPEVWCNLAAGYNFQRRYQESIQAAWTAVTMRDDDKDLIETLARALHNAPEKILNANPKVREINEQAQVIFRKHGIPGVGGPWKYLRPKQGGPSDRPPDEQGGPPGVQWSGSGFFVTTDGYLITNHHVAAGDAHKEVPKGITWRVRMDDGTEKPAKLIAMDDKADIAIMKIEGQTTEFLKIATDNPEQGAEALVLGYPATFSTEHTLQISKGTVKSVHPEEEYNIWFDLNTTHGNSGGPIVDRDGHVIGILTAGGKVYDMTLTMGVGPNQIETFLSNLGDTAPKVEYVTPITTDDGVPLDSQKLTRLCRKATVLVLAVRGAEEGDKPADKPADAPADPAAPSDPGAGGSGGDTGGGAGGGDGKGRTGGSR